MCYEKMAKHVSKAANRGLGLVIAKGSFGGFNFESFSKGKMKRKNTFFYIVQSIITSGNLCPLIYHLNF